MSYFNSGTPLELGLLVPCTRYRVRVRLGRVPGGEYYAEHQGGGYR